jgi:hypothetical protein
MTAPYGYVPPNGHRELSQRHVDVLHHGATLAGGVMGQPQQTHHARSDDNAITVSLGALIYSGAYGVVFLVITAMLGWLAWAKLGVDGTLVVACMGIAWGCASYYALAHNRAQSLRHSTSGIAHAEIESRERVALAAMDNHTRIILAQLEMHDDEDETTAPLSRRIH